MKLRFLRISVLLMLLPAFWLIACSKKVTEEVNKSSTTPANNTGSSEKKNIRLFLIGNSFSQNATTYLPNLAAEGGHTLTIGRAESSSYSLQMHWEGVEANLANPSDPKGKPYKGKSLKELLSAGTWDIVTLQQVSSLSGNEDSFQPYLNKLVAFIKGIQPQAEIVLHETWAYRSDATGFTQIKGGSHASSEQQMWERIHNAYSVVSKSLGFRVIPVGDAFWQLSSSNTWKYKKDMSFNYNSPVYPNLPNEANSLHVGYYWDATSSPVFGFDSHHASAAGCYLGSLTWYYFLFKQSPANLIYKPSSISSEFSTALKQAAEIAITTSGL